MNRRMLLAALLAIASFGPMAAATSYDPSYRGLQGIILDLYLSAADPAAISTLQRDEILPELMAQATDAFHQAQRDIAVFSPQTFDSAPATLLEDVVMRVQVRVDLATVSDQDGRKLLAGAAGLFLQRTGYPSQQYLHPLTFFLIPSDQDAALQSAVRKAASRQLQFLIDHIIKVKK